ncbi:hypothetical protein HII13_000108 [Brettanomyces bruxellensis]|uniref:DEBR0S4_09494g1_1 n=1 Tax=Dekkera bruxellensis TaxID=5007 RepID=A0A7D9H164_DEKBR|nr:hypothetical protein HII13_000108 [Brettanomyces bruxellensis]VUG19062.1 DEBR0S4_09494g1_1 [Brettanomyces bruxellensis]
MPNDAINVKRENTGDESGLDANSDASPQDLRGELDDDNTNSPESDSVKFHLPKQFPLQRSIRTKLSSVGLYELEKSKDSIINKYVERAKEIVTAYIGTVLEENAEKLMDHVITRKEFEEERHNMYRKDPNIEKIRKHMQKIRDISLKSAIFTQALDSVKSKVIEANEPEFSPESLDSFRNYKRTLLPDLLEQNLEHLQGQNNQDASLQRQAYQKYKDFEKYIFVTINPEQPIPFSDDDDDISGTDDELAVEGGKVSLLCPISHYLIETPVMSRRCGHTYDKASVLNYLKNSAECPVCPKALSYTDLVKDPVMLQRLTCYKRDKKIFKERNIKEKEIEDKL